MDLGMILMVIFGVLGWYCGKKGSEWGAIIFLTLFGVLFAGTGLGEKIAKGLVDFAAQVAA